MKKKIKYILIILILISSSYFIYKSCNKQPEKVNADKVLPFAPE